MQLCHFFLKCPWLEWSSLVTGFFACEVCGLGNSSGSGSGSLSFSVFDPRNFTIATVQREIFVEQIFTNRPKGKITRKKFL